jgi:PKD repeat protein
VVVFKDIDEVGEFLTIYSTASDASSLLFNHKVQVQMGAGPWVTLIDCWDANTDGYCDFMGDIRIADLKSDSTGDLNQLKIGPFADGDVINYRSLATDTVLPAGNSGTSVEKSFTVKEAKEWIRTYKEAGFSEIPRYIEQTSDGGYIVMGERFDNQMDYDFLLMKIDSSGVQEWTKTFGEIGIGNKKYDHGFSVQELSNSEYIIAGDSRSFAPNNASEFMVIKLDSNGNKIWTRTFDRGAGVYNKGRAILEVNDGYIVAGNSGSSVAGYNITVLKLDFNGDKQWIKTYSKSGITQHFIDKTLDNGYVLVFGCSGTVPGDNDGVIMKIDSDGSVVWSKAFGGVGGDQDDFPKTVKKTSDGGYIVVGRTTSFSGLETTDDMFVLKFLSDGSLDWARALYDDEDSGVDFNDEWAYSVQEDSDGYVIAGQIAGYSGSTKPNPIIVKINLLGDVMWAKIVLDVTTLNTDAVQVQKTADGGYIVTGTTGTTAYVIKFDSLGNIPGCNVIDPTFPILSTDVKPLILVRELGISDTNVTGQFNQDSPNPGTVSPNLTENNACMAVPTLSVSLSASPNPVEKWTNIDLTATVGGTATGNIDYRFDCENDGSWDVTSLNNPNANYTALAACNYATEGSYTALVEVTRQGVTATDTVVINIVVNVPPFQANAGYYLNECGNNDINGKIVWNFTDSNPGDYQSKYQLTLNKGSVAGPPYLINETVFSSVTERAVNSGIFEYGETYTMVVKVWDSFGVIQIGGGQTTWTFDAYENLNAEFTFNPPLPIEGNVVDFFIDPDINEDPNRYPPYTWSWDFDGDSIEDSNLQNPNYTFSSAGNYNVSLRVIGQIGPMVETCNTTQTITVATPNNLPIITSVTITPDPAYTDNDLTANPAATDADGDPITYSYQWKNNGVDIGADNPILLSTNFVKNDNITVTVTPNDGTNDGLPIISVSLTISNTSPTQPTVSVAPNPAYVDEDLICSPTDSADADGDVITYNYKWYKDGTLQPQIIDTINSASTAVGETWKCRVTPNDGTDDGSFIEDSTVILALPGATFPTVFLQAEDKDGNIISDGAFILNSLVNPSIIKSTAIANNGGIISDHIVEFTNDNWATIKTVDCLLEDCNNIDLNTYFGLLTAGTTIKYKAQATDDSAVPQTTYVGEYSFNVIAGPNTDPLADNLLVSPMNYCEKNISEIEFMWDFTDTEDGVVQTAYQIDMERDGGGPGNICSTNQVFSVNLSVTAAGINSKGTCSPDFISYGHNNYTWSVTVWDSGGASDAESYVGSINDIPDHQYPTAKFKFTPQPPAIILQLQPIDFDPLTFPDNSICYDSSNISVPCKQFDWNYDKYIDDIFNNNIIDKTTLVASPNAIHNYSEKAKYTVDLMVTDNSPQAYSCWASDKNNEKDVNIGENKPKWNEINP